MIEDFGDRTTADIYHGEQSKAAAKIPRELWSRIRRKLDYMAAAHRLEDLMAPPSNRLERLKGDLAGMYSIRVNDQFRIIFRAEQGRFSQVRCVDYH